MHYSKTSFDKHTKLECLNVFLDKNAGKFFTNFPTDWKHTYQIPVFPQEKWVFYLNGKKSYKRSQSLIYTTPWPWVQDLSQEQARVIQTPNATYWMGWNQTHHIWPSPPCMNESYQIHVPVVTNFCLSWMPRPLPWPTVPHLQTVPWNKWPLVVMWNDPSWRGWHSTLDLGWIGSSRPWHFAPSPIWHTL